MSPNPLQTFIKLSKTLLNTDADLFLCGMYMPPKKSAYFDNALFDELENDLIAFASKLNTTILGDFNARTNNLDNFVSRDDGNNFINDTSENCLQSQNRENFDSNRNNPGKQIINICKNTDMRILNG